MKKLILPVSVISVFLLIIIACAKKENEPVDNKLIEQTTVINLIYEEMVEQGFLENDDYDQFISDIEITKEKLDIERNSSYDSVSSTTSTTISIVPNEGSLKDVTIIVHIPKEVAESVLDIIFKIPPTHIIKEDPLIMWHFASVDDRVDLAYEVSKSNSSTGSIVALSPNYYVRLNQDVPSDFPSMEMYVSNLTPTSATISVHAISNGTDIGKVYLWVQESTDMEPTGMGSYKDVGTGAGEYTVNLNNISPNQEYLIKGALNDYTYHFNYFSSLWITTSDNSIGTSPIADYSASQTTITEGESINFTDQSINNPTSWDWDFGDGSTSSSQNPSHTYYSKGTYSVSLTATNEFGQDTETKNDYVNVSGEDNVPSDIIFNPDLTYGTLTDIDGNTYKTIQIGSQTWMAQNLATTKYNDGNSINLSTNGSIWADSPVYCWYNDDKAEVKNTYGALYNWYTVNSSDLCPSGWHVPNDNEWNTLSDYLGGLTEASAKLREAGFVHWESPNVYGNNESGFTALPGGTYDFHSKSYNYLGTAGYWWSKTGSNGFASIRSLLYDYGTLYRYTSIYESVYSVRCIKD